MNILGRTLRRVFGAVFTLVKIIAITLVFAVMILIVVITSVSRQIFFATYPR